jgi:predicted O-methyltransferase YrrM
MSGILRRVVRRLPGAQWMAGRLRHILGETDIPQTRVPPGHFYSPIPSLDFIREREASVFSVDRKLHGIRIDDPLHREFLGELLPMLPDFPFRSEHDEGHRYVDNGYFAYFDGFVLHGMMRRSKPRTVIEVGSGFSSGLILDVNERYLDGEAELFFIEPYPERLRSRLLDSDVENPKVQILEEFVQDVPLEFFDRLEKNDILFIDSSHVSKTGSDVNFLYFEVLPRLRPGVLIHVHDVHYPFEYPRLWAEQERAWNEVYLLHAFLAYNEAFEIVFQCDYARRFLADWFEAQMPGFLATSEHSAAKIKCGSIWLRRK